MAEQSLSFDCEGARLCGVLHPAAGARAMVIVVGGPQYRVGSHRQFVHLARCVARAGFPVMRFDCRGMGDSEGEHPGFERLQPDIRAAIDALFERAGHVEEVVLWGLCDAASAILLYVREDERVCGAALANPWVRTEASEAGTYLRHYYVQRLLSRAFWRDLIGGRFRPGAALGDLVKKIRLSLRPPTGDDARPDRGAYPQRMLRGLDAFDGRVMLLLSGQDLTAAEFSDLVRSSESWQAVLSRGTVTEHRLEQATHTFSSAQWRDAVAEHTVDWLRSW